MTDRKVHCNVIDGVAVLTIDNPPVNALSMAVRRQLLDAVRTYATRSDIVGMVVIGAGNTFSAGADLSELEQPLKDPQLPQLVAAIEACYKPVIAAISGTALGSGFELALGCDARIAAPDGVVGSPEVTFGMIPGGGATQRLPRLVGIAKAIDLICGGTRFTAAEAVQMGAIDTLVSDDLLDEALALSKRAGKRIVRELSVPQGLERDIAQAQRLALAKGRNRPAVTEAIEAILNAARIPVSEALEYERTVFQRLRVSAESAALRYQFFAERSAGKVVALEGVPPRVVEAVGIIGGGTMGSAIAAAFLDAGIPVTLVEQSESMLSAGSGRVENIYRRQVTSGRLHPEVREARLANLTTSLRYADLAKCQLVFEAVFEELQVKMDVMKNLAAVVAPDTVIAMTTSHLDIDVIATAYPYPENVLGVHFFSPASVMRLMEMVAGEHTSVTTLATAMAMGKRLRKVPVISRNASGFIADRLFSAYRRHAEFLVEEGASPYAVDEAMEAFGFAMGPFAVADLAGLDLAWRLRKSQSIGRDPQARYVAIPDLLCERGYLGRKTGVGYYRHHGGKREHDPRILELIADYRAGRQITSQVFTVEQIQRRLLLAIVNEAALVMAAGVASNPVDIDLAFVNGYGFARWLGGPVFWARQQDPTHLREELFALSQLSGPGFPMGDLTFLGM